MSWLRSTKADPCRRSRTHDPSPRRTHRSDRRSDEPSEGHSLAISIRRHVGAVRASLCAIVERMCSYARRSSALGLAALLMLTATACDTATNGRAEVSVEQAQGWARGRGATATFIALAPIYWRQAPRRAGVRPEVAYAQSAKETAFGRFGGSVTPDYHNPCGLKRREGGADHMRFANWATGVRACIDHLALYSGAEGYPRASTPDPRHFDWLYGTAPTVESLGGKWAPSPTYGVSIVNDYLIPMQNS